MADNNQALSRREESGLMSDEILSPVMNLAVAKQRLQEFQAFIQEYFVKDEDFGTIPGTNKPTLLKPGADKLCELYGLSDSYEFVDKVEDYEAHPALFDYTIRCTISRIRTGVAVAQGLGSCSTWESKYRYRDGKRKCPSCGAEAIIKGKDEYGGGWLCFAKKGGCGAKFKDDDKSITSQSLERIDNPDIMDLKNTVIKMAKKRAKIDATLSATRSSGIFTQDVEDMDPGSFASGSQMPPDPTEKPAGKPTASKPSTKPPAARKAAQPDVVMCNQCRSTNGHTPDCPTRQPAKTQAKAEPVKAEQKKSRGWLVINSIEDKKTKEVIKDGKKSGGRAFISLQCADGDGQAYELTCWHATISENRAALIGKWADVEIVAKPKTANPDEFFYSLETVFATQTEAGTQPWSDNVPQEGVILAPEEEAEQA